MSDQDWQNAVLYDLGVPRSGLVTPANLTGSAASPGPAAYLPQPDPPQPAGPPQSYESQGFEQQAALQQPGSPQSYEVHPYEPQAGPPESNPEGAHPVVSAPLAAPIAESPANGSQASYELQQSWPVSPQEAPPAQPPADPWNVESQPAAHQPSEIDLAPWDPQASGQPDRPDQAGTDQEYPDLVHPDLVFPDLGHPSLGQVEPSAAPLEIQPDQSFKNAWNQRQDQAAFQHPPAHQQPGPQQQPGPAQWNQAAQAPPAPPGYGMPQPPQSPQQPRPQAFAGGLLSKKAHGDPLMRRMGRGISKAVGASAGQEAREGADLAGRIRLPVPTCRRIAVTSIRGGAGKTTVAGLTATMITLYRQDRVLAADADSGLGSLPLRMGVQTELSLQDLARSRPRSWEEASRFMAHSADGLWVLSNTSRGRIGAELEIDTFRAATGELNRYFSAIVIDCGAGILPELQRGILAEAHAHVLVTPATVDGALSARGALDWMAGNGFGALLPRTVVTLVTHSPHEDADLERAHHMLSAGGMTVVHVPYDRHLASGTPIELALTGEATQHATTRIAAEVFSRAASV